jgi:DNA-directed RNA polymerase specialized sigma subunit
MRQRFVTWLLRELLEQGEDLMAAIDDLRALLQRVDTATTEIAADIQVLKDKIGTQMTQADVDEVKAGLEAAATKLESTAAGQ